MFGGLRETRKSWILLPLRRSQGSCFLLAAAVWCGGCSLWYESTRPEPGAPRNLFCWLEYRPLADGGPAPDLLFVAAARPYRWEEVYMNPLDGLLHTVVAPGRHLTRELVVEGATCRRRPWPRGHRLPERMRPRGGLVCTREGLAAVAFEAETRWGSCSQQIAAGDAQPRCREWYGQEGKGGLRELPSTVCAQPAGGN